MRLVYALLFFITLPVQYPVVTRVNAPDVTITGFGWATPPAHQYNPDTSKQRDTLLNTPYTVPTRPDPFDFPSPDEIRGSVPPSANIAPEMKPSISIGVKNSGSRDIKAISWEVIFSDRKTTDEYLHLTFETKRRVHSGESLMLDHKFRNKSDWKRFQQAVQNQFAAVKVKITGIQYADGTSWKP